MHSNALLMHMWDSMYIMDPITHTPTSAFETVGLHLTA